MPGIVVDWFPWRRMSKGGAGWVKAARELGMPCPTTCVVAFRATVRMHDCQKTVGFVPVYGSVAEMVPETEEGP